MHVTHVHVHVYAYLHVHACAHAIKCLSPQVHTQKDELVTSDNLSYVTKLQLSSALPTVDVIYDEIASGREPETTYLEIVD